MHLYVIPYLLYLLLLDWYCIAPRQLYLLLKHDFLCFCFQLRNIGIWAEWVKFILHQPAAVAAASPLRSHHSSYGLRTSRSLYSLSISNLYKLQYTYVKLCRDGHQQSELCVCIITFQSNEFGHLGYLETCAGIL